MGNHGNRLMDLQELRIKIDSIDRGIVRLLNDRYEVVKQVGEWKRERGEPIYVPEREKALLEKLETINRGPMPNSTLRAVYREIMSGALRLENPLKVAFFGPEATFTHLAAKMKFGHGVEYLSKSTIADVFHAVESGKCDYGCVPVENSTEGVVNYTLDMLMDSSVKICAEINMRIQQCLLSNTEKSKIKVVYSHAQSLGQCRNWLTEHLPGVETIAVVSNSRAADLAAREEGAAAIGSELAAEVYGLKIVEKGIQDNPNNTTRFLVTGTQEVKPSGQDKTSICFAIKDRVGALYDCLLPFKHAGVTLTMIESRPSKRRNWEYLFFIDMLGHATDPEIAEALKELNTLAHSLKVLGSYPCAIPLE